jgi:hypothetical protein
VDPVDFIVVVVVAMSFSLGDWGGDSVPVDAGLFGAETRVTEISGRPLLTWIAPSAWTSDARCSDRKVEADVMSGHHHMW